MNLRLPLDDVTLRRVARTLVGLSVFFALGTIAFIAAFAQQEQYQQLERNLIQYVLVQVHLATENVIAAWFSSMMLLCVAAAALIAYTLPRPSPAPATPAWLTRGWLTHGWLVIAIVFAILSFDELGSLHERIGMVVSIGNSGKWGWVYVLAVPILVTGGYMLAFAWTYVRPVTTSFRLFLIGLAFFLSNPVVEQIEMTLIHGAGAEPGTWARFAHDTLLVLEEGVLELFGTICFLMAVLTWLRAHVFAAQDPSRPSLTARIHPELAAKGGLIAAGVAAAGIPLSLAAIRIMPDADSGLPMNWFPAAASFVLFLVTMGARAAVPFEQFVLRRQTQALAVLAVAISAYFGAGIHGYSDWGSFDAIRELLRMVLSVGFAVVCVTLARSPQGEYIGALLVAAILMPCAISITGPHATLAASLAAFAAATAIAAAPQQSFVPDPSARVLNPESRILNPSSGIPTPPSRIPNREPVLTKSSVAVPNEGFPMRDPR